MIFMGKNSWVWAVDKPEDVDFQRYVGHHVKVRDDDGRELVVEIESIQGSLAHPTKFQINSKEKSYFISMLDFYSQMNGERIPQDQIELFDQTQFHVQEKKKPFSRWRLKNKLWSKR